MGQFIVGALVYVVVKVNKVSGGFFGNGIASFVGVNGVFGDILEVFFVKKIIF